jgi:hypothetical protein
MKVWEDFQILIKMIYKNKKKDSRIEEEETINKEWLKQSKIHK